MRSHDTAVRSALRHRGFDCLGIDPDLPVPDAHSIAPQGPAWPSRGNIAVVKIERGQMTRAKQAAVVDTAQAQIGLFMRTGPFSSKNPIAVANQQQIDGLEPHADARWLRERTRWPDRNPCCAVHCGHHTAVGPYI